MITTKLMGKKPKMIAHRGASGVVCENTCIAFEVAGWGSYYGIETDVHISKDGQYVIYHDDDTSRLADGKKMVIEESNYADLQALTLRCPKKKEKWDQYKIPLLADYIGICKKYQKRCILEIKKDFSDEELDGMLAIIDQFDYRENVTFISFHRGPLMRLRKKLPTCVAQYLTDKANDDTLEFLDEYNLDLDIYFPKLSQKYVEKVHAHGHEVNCWTVDEEWDAKKLIKMGVDYITSNILE